MTARITRAEYAALVAADMKEDALQAQVEALAFDLGWRHLLENRILAELTSRTAAPLLLEKELKNG